jgi:hypothetical protein
MLGAKGENELVAATVSDGVDEDARFPGSGEIQVNRHFGCGVAVEITVTLALSKLAT